MSNTFAAITGQGDNDEFEVDNAFGYQTAEKIRQDLNVLAYLGGILDLGGSDDVAVSAGSPPDWEPVRGYRDYSLNADELGGLTLEVVVYSRAEGASPAPEIDWRLRNTTDGSNAAEGTAHSEITTQKEVQTVTLTTGAKDYRLEVLGDAYVWGYLRFRSVPA